MPGILQSETFREWLAALRDVKGRGRILIRIGRLEAGNPGDHKGVGNGVVELRMTFGPGCRVYYKPEGDTIVLLLAVLLLAGGDKSAQDADIAKAKAIATEREKGDGGSFQPL